MEELLEKSTEELTMEELLEKSMEEELTMEELLEKSTEEELLEKSTEEQSGIKLRAQTEEVFPEVEDMCDQCQGEANVFCKECNNSYCTTCSIQRHRAGKRKEHFIARLSKMITKVVHVPLEDVLSQPQGTSLLQNI